MEKYNLEELVELLTETVDDLYNVPMVGEVYDQQHSDTHLRAVLRIEDFLKKIC